MYNVLISVALEFPSKSFLEGGVYKLKYTITLKLLSY